MNKGLLILLLFFIIKFDAVYAQSNAFLLFGGDKNDYGVSLVEKSNAKGYLVLGSTRSYGSGSSDYYFISLNADFLQLSENAIGGIHHDIPSKIKRIAFNEYIVLGAVYDFKPGLLNHSLTYVDGLGNFLKRDVLWRGRTDIPGNFLLENNNEKVIFGMAAQTDKRGQAKLMKVNSEGELYFEVEYGDLYVSDYGFDILSQNDGYLLLSTHYCEFTESSSFITYTLPSDISVLKVNLEGEVQWEYRYEGDDFDYAYSFVEINDFVYVAVNTRSEDSQSFDIKVLKIDDQGLLVDSFDFGGEGFEYAYKILRDSNDDLLLCGVSASDVDKPSFYALKIGTDGELLWEKKISEDASIYAYDVIENAKGNYVFTGKYATELENSDLFLIELNKSGDIISNQDQTANNEILIYPNPSNGTLVLNSGEISVETVLIYSITGKLVYQEEYSNVGSFIPIDLNELSGGVYILEAVDSHQNHHQQKITLY